MPINSSFVKVSSKIKSFCIKSRTRLSFSNVSEAYKEYEPNELIEPKSFCPDAGNTTTEFFTTLISNRVSINGSIFLDELDLSEMFSHHSLHPSRKNVF